MLILFHLIDIFQSKSNCKLLVILFILNKWLLCLMFVGFPLKNRFRSKSRNILVTHKKWLVAFAVSNDRWRLNWVSFNVLNHLNLLGLKWRNNKWTTVRYLFRRPTMTLPNTVLYFIFLLAVNKQVLFQLFLILTLRMWGILPLISLQIYLYWLYTYQLFNTKHLLIQALCLSFLF